MTTMEQEKTEAPALDWKALEKQITAAMVPVDTVFTLPQVQPEKESWFKAFSYDLLATKPVIDYTPDLPQRGEPLVTQFLSALAAVVVEVGPNYVYTPRRQSDGGLMATYLHEGEGDCLVGRALLRMGVTRENLRQMEGTNASEAIGRLYPRGTAGVSQMAYVAQVAQRSNDSRNPWGHALMEARQAGAMYV